MHNGVTFCVPEFLGSQNCPKSCEGCRSIIFQKQFLGFNNMKAVSSPDYIKKSYTLRAYPMSIEFNLISFNTRFAFNKESLHLLHKLHSVIWS
jgi:hypothetical protein